MATESLLPTPASAPTLVTGNETWRLDLEHGRVSGSLSGEDANQASLELVESVSAESTGQEAMRALSVPRFQHLIYSPGYGHELESLIGRDFAYLSAAAPTLITEALSQDDRITRVSDFQFTQLDGQVAITFTMTTSQGEQQMTLTL